jgi:hypothetical protein
MSGSHHVWVKLPDGTRSCADYREPIVKAMRAYNRRVSTKKDPDPRDVAAIRDWHEAWSEQVAQCITGSCGHKVS